MQRGHVSHVKQRAGVPLRRPQTHAGQCTHRHAARAPWQVFPLVDPSKGYTHISPGVCDACITDASGEPLPTANPILLLWQPVSAQPGATEQRPNPAG
jgi:hypothetical protein